MARRSASSRRCRMSLPPLVTLDEASDRPYRQPAGDGLANPITGNGNCGAEHERDVLSLLQEAAQCSVFDVAQILGCLTPQVLDPLDVGDGHDVAHELGGLQV